MSGFGLGIGFSGRPGFPGGLSLRQPEDPRRAFASRDSSRRAPTACPRDLGRRCTSSQTRPKWTTRRCSPRAPDARKCALRCGPRCGPQPGKGTHLQAASDPPGAKSHRMAGPSGLTMRCDLCDWGGECGPVRSPVRSPRSREGECGTFDPSRAQSPVQRNPLVERIGCKACVLESSHACQVGRTGSSGADLS